MIRNDRELAAAQAQITHLERVLQQMRQTASSDDFLLLVRSSRPMIERIQREVLDYLSLPAPHVAQLHSTASAARR
jgi:hypothetical protein